MPEDRDRPLPPGIIRSRDMEAGPIRPSPSPDSLLRRREGGRADRPSEIGPSRITAIEPQQKRAGRVSVYVDGRFAVGLFEDVAAALGLKVGQTITPEELEEAARVETLRKALEDAYNLLSYRDRAEKELADRLARKGYAEDVIGTTLEKLKAAGYLDDASFARRWVVGRGQTRGRLALARELRQKGVDRETAAEALDEVQDGDADRTAARTAAVRRVGERPADRSPEARARLAAFLQRRGFTWDTVRPILAELYGYQEGDEEDIDLHEN